MKDQGLHYQPLKWACFAQVLYMFDIHFSLRKRVQFDWRKTCVKEKWCIL